MAGRGKEKLTKDGIQTALRLCRAGLPDCQIAAVLGVSKETYSRWINHPKTDNQNQLRQFDYQLDRHCSKTAPCDTSVNRMFDYQLDRHCSKTCAGLLPRQRRFDYQLDRHCSKTLQAATTWRLRGEAEQDNKAPARA